MLIYLTLFNIFQDSMYYFYATVLDVSNKEKPYYHSCKFCTKSLGQQISTDGEIECRHCKEKIICVPKYIVKINVVDENQYATITLFEEAASTFIGCPISEYMKSKV